MKKSLKPKNDYKYSIENNPDFTLTCSTLSEQQPTVSAASSVSFSFPALKANLSIKYIATALWRLNISLSCKSALIYFNDFKNKI